MIRSVVAALALSALAACTAVAGPQVPAEAPSGTVGGVRVTEVIDGDTARLRDGRTVRVLWIDTPETKDPRKPVQCFGPEASAEAHRLLDGQQVGVIAKRRPDRYGRTLAAIILPDGRDFSRVMVEEGLARVYTPDTTTELRNAEAAARSAHRGLWGPPCNGKV